MSTEYSPFRRNAAGALNLFGGEDTLVWNFTSAAGDPLIIRIGGVDNITFNRTGGMEIESDITWNTDSSGDVGTQFDLRPGNVNTATKVAVGAVFGVGDGAKLELDKLTLGHANVDKYIDAEQGLVNTPAVRYNAVSARWEFSDNGITYVAFSAGFGTTTWDALYAADKLLLIDTTVLTFTQTSTSGLGFKLDRNLAAGFTDSAIVGIENGNAADDQPALAIAHVTTAADALQILEGTIAGGTERYAFGAAGQLHITTNAALAAPLLLMEQTDDDEAFFRATGTSAADASKNISTANAPTADMIRVEVDAGAPATRWLPLYNSHVLPGAPTWDSIYAIDKTLDIDTSVLTFDQSATSGIGFTVSRNLDLTNTDNPLMTIENTHTGDDQSALLVTGGTAAYLLRVINTNPDVTAGLGVYADAKSGFALTVPNGVGTFNSVSSDITASAGLAATDFVRTYYASITPHAGDNAATVYTGFYAAGNVTGAALKYGHYADANWTYGIYSDSESYVQGVVLKTQGIDIGPVGVTDKTITAIQTGVNDPYIQYDSATSKWVVSHTGVGEFIIPASWDDLYANDKTLDIDTSVLTFSQSSTAGVGFAVGRNLAAANTDSPIMTVDNQNGTDDQPALQTLGAITTGGPVNTIESQINSGGMTGGTEIGRALNLIVTEAAADAVGASLCGAYASLAGVAGGATKYAFRAGVGFNYGFYSLSKAEVANTVTPAASFNLVLSNTDFSADAGLGAAVVYSGFRSKVYGHAADNAGAFLYGFHAQGDGTTGTAATKRAYYADANWDVGFCSISPIGLYSAYTFNTPGGSVNLNEARITSNITTLGDSIRDFYALITQNAGDTGGSQFGYLAEITGTKGAALSEAFRATAAWDFGLFSLSKIKLDMDTDDALIGIESEIDSTGLGAADEVQGFYADIDGHNTDDATSLMYGFYADGAKNSSAGTFYGVYANSGWDYGVYSTSPVFGIISGITAATNVIEANVISGGLGAAEYAIGVYSKATGIIGDDATSANIGFYAEGIKNSSPGTMLGVWIDSGWDTGLYCQAPSSIEVSVGTALYLAQSGAGNKILDCYDANLSEGRMSLFQDGEFKLDSNHNGIAFSFGQSNTGDIFVWCDGTATGGVARLSLGELGKLIISTDAALGDVALNIDQNDADKPFVYFEGTPSNPAAGDYPADNVTEINGAGVVVGPQTVSGSPNTGWAFKSMVRCKVDLVGGGTIDGWVCLYEPIVS